MIVNKKALCLKKICDKNNLILSNIQVTKEWTTATNRFILLQYKNNQEDLKNFPEICDKENIVDGEVLLSQKTIEKLDKIMPKSNISILENFVIEKKDDKVVCNVTDLDNNLKIEQENIEEKFPEIEKYYPTEDKKIKITLSCDLLEDLIGVIKNFTSKGCTGIDLTVYSEDRAILINFNNQEKGVKVRGLILPMKGEVNDDLPSVI